MKGGKAPLGYTIIEVMIVLAVSGMMFAIAANFISGKQARTQFTQGVNELASRLQHGIDQVSDGQYTDINISCTFASGVTDAHANANPLDLTGANPTEQGTHTDCIFLGKIFHFDETYNSGNPRSQYEVFTMAGGRLDGSGNAITFLDDTKPSTIDTLTTQEIVPQYLEVRKITVTIPHPDGTTTTDSSSYGIGFLRGLGSIQAGAYANGGQSISLYYVVGLGDGIGPATSPSSPTYPVAGRIIQITKADICVSDGNRSSLVTLGANNANLAVTITAKQGGDCA